MDAARYIRELTTPHAPSTTRSTAAAPGTAKTTSYASLAPHPAADVRQPFPGFRRPTRAGYSPTPATRLDALDPAARIDIETARWVIDVNEEPHTTDTTPTRPVEATILPLSQVMSRPG